MKMWVMITEARTTITIITITQKKNEGRGAGKNPARNADPKAAPPSLPAPYVALRFWWP